MASKKHKRKNQEPPIAVAYDRINPMGDTEQVISNGNNTLNEAIFRLLEEVSGYSISSEELPWQRSQNIAPFTPQLVTSSGDRMKENGDTLSNMTMEAPLVDNLDDIRSDDEKATDRDKGFEFYNPNAVEVHNESVCSTGGVATGALPLLFDKNGSRSKGKKKKRNKSDLNGAIDGLLTQIVR